MEIPQRALQISGCAQWYCLYQLSKGAKPPPHTTYVVFYTTYILKKKRKRKENLLYLSVQVLHGQPRVALSQTLPRKATIGQGELQAGGRQKRWWGGVVWQDAILDQRKINS